MKYLSIMKFTTALVVGVGLAATSIETATAARPVPEQVENGLSRVIQYDDLDLGRPEDAETLYERISRAAKIVCRDQRSIRNVSMYQAYKLCLETAVNGAVARVNHVNLTALHNGRSQALAAR